MSTRLDHRASHKDASPYYMFCYYLFYIFDNDATTIPMMERSPTLRELKSILIPGQAYRRETLMSLSSNIDRHLQKLVSDGCLKKLQHGVYLCPFPPQSAHAPIDETSLLKSFLRDDHFVLYSPSMFSSLGLAVGQHAHRKIVFNRRRHGVFELGERVYYFHRWREAPKLLSQEFLFVAYLNRMGKLSKMSKDTAEKLLVAFSALKPIKLERILSRYGKQAAQIRYESLLEFKNGTSTLE